VSTTLCRPRIECAQRFRATRAQEAVDVAGRAGLELDWHQQLVLSAGCAWLPKTGRWQHFEVGVCEPRQNGKNAILLARELAGMFAWEEGLIVHSAHMVDTSLEHFERLLSLIESVPEFDQQVHRVSRTNGREGITLKKGPRIRFRSRSKGGGRGFSCDTIIFDEAMFVPESFHGALMPTLRARPNPQVWYAASAVDQEIHEHGLVLTRLRERAKRGDSDALCYFEWSLDYDRPEDIPEEVVTDPDTWAAVNPALGDRITSEHVAMELEALDRRTFAVEILGVGDWPDPTGRTDAQISVEQWAACQDEASTLLDPVCIAFDVSPERRTSIAAAGRNAEGHWHVEVLEKMAGTHWLADRLAQLDAQHSPQAIVCDAVGPAASIVPDLTAAGLTVEMVAANEHAQACGRLVDVVREERLRHLGSLDLWNAIRGARTRHLGDRWAWSRKSSAVDISPLVAATLALWAAMGQPESDGEVVIY
jgi:phage terminase large subunit-like protein